MLFHGRIRYLDMYSLLLLGLRRRVLLPFFDPITWRWRRGVLDYPQLLWMDLNVRLLRRWLLNDVLNVIIRWLCLVLNHLNEEKNYDY